MDPIVPSDLDTVLAASARHAIADITMRDLPPVVMRLLVDILNETEIGNAVALVPIEAEITTQQGRRSLDEIVALDQELRLL